MRSGEIIEALPVSELFLEINVILTSGGLVKFLLISAMGRLELAIGLR